MARTKAELQALVNEFLGKPTVPTVTEKEREALCLAMLDKVCGPGDEILIGHLAEIVEGASGRDVLKGGALVTVYPTANERTNAARLLRTWHRGLAARSIKVDQTVTHKVKWNPDKLSLTDLEALERMHGAAATRALPANTVNGEFSEAPEPVQEMSEIQENPESED